MSPPSTPSPRPIRGRRRVVVGVVVGAVCVALAVALAEVWFRWQTFHGLGPWRLGGTVRQGVEDEYCQYDELLGWRGRPGFVGLHYRANLPPTPLAFNNRGWRDVERSSGRVPGKARVVLLGDSFAMGLGVPVEQGVAALLEKELGAEVVNLGMNGYSTDQELLVLEGEGLAYRPDVVVVLFHYNDLAQNVFPVTFLGYIKPCFTLDGEGRLALQYHPGPHGGPTPGWTQAAGRVLRNHSELYRRLWVKSRMAAVRAGHASPVSPFDYAGPQARRIALSPDMQGLDRNAVVMLGKLLRRMDELARTVGARTLVAVAPLSEQVRQLAAEPTPPHPERLMPDGIMHGFGQTTGIPTLLLMPFLVEAERGTPTAYAREFHWTPAGHLAAAEAIAAEIRRRGWLPCP